MQFESRRPEPRPPSGKCGKCGQSKPRTRNQGTDRRRIAHRFPRLKRTDREKTQGPGRPRKAEGWEGCGQSPPRTRGPETTQERIAHRLSTPVRAPNPRATETPGNRKTRPRKTAVETPATTQYPQPRIEQAAGPQTVQYVLNPIIRLQFFKAEPNLEILAKGPGIATGKPDRISSSWVVSVLQLAVRNARDYNLDERPVMCVVFVNKFRNDCYNFVCSIAAVNRCVEPARHIHILILSA